MKRLLGAGCSVLLSLVFISNAQAQRSQSTVTTKPAISVRVENGKGILTSVTPGSATLRYAYRKKGRECMKVDVELSTNGKFVRSVRGKQPKNQRMSAMPCNNYPVAKLYPSSTLVQKALAMCPQKISSGKKRTTIAMKASATVKATACHRAKGSSSNINYRKASCSKFAPANKRVTSSTFKYHVLVTCFMGLKRQNHTDGHTGGTLAPTKSTIKTKTTTGPPRKPTTTPTRRKAR